MLNITGLNQFYGGSHILRDVTMEVPKGSLTVLLGRNGVGKTTLLRCLMGLVRAKSGTIAWAGQPLAASKTNPAKPHPNLEIIDPARSNGPTVMAHHCRMWRAREAAARPIAC